MDNAISRRGLIGAGAGLAASATVLGARTLGADAAETRAVGDGDRASLLPVDRIGLQLYSVRDEVSNLGFDKVLAKLAEIGFKHVEFAGYTDNSSPALTVKQLRGLLDKYGLKAAGSHVSPSDDASMKKILDDAEVLGIPYVGNSLVVPEGPPSTDGWKAAAATANKYGEMAAKRGMKYYLHNHFQEWAPCVDDPSKCGHDVFLAECDPRYAFLELDIYWCYVGSAQNQGTRAFDPLKDYILKHSDRYLLFHVKDGVYDDTGKPTGTITDVGEGKIDFQTIFTELFKKSADEPNKHIYLWENDDAGNHPRGALAAAQSSYANMRYSLTKAAPAGTGAGPGTGTVNDVTECTTASGLSAAINSARFRTTKAGRRVVSVGLRLNSSAQVTAKLTRGRKVLAKQSKQLSKGSPKLNLTLPRKTAKGPVLLTITVKKAGGNVLTVRRTLHVPGGKKK
jgi:sugar phosphate isomerase/epimerase